MLQGINASHEELMQQNYAEGLAARDRERSAYNALLSSPDPDIRAMAASGMLEMAQPAQRQSGFAGWMGKIQASKTYPQMQTLMRSPVMRQMQVPGTPTLSSTQTSQGVPVAPGVQPTLDQKPETAGMTTAPPATQGGPPPKPTGYTTPGADVATRPSGIRFGDPLPTPMEAGMENGGIAGRVPVSDDALDPFGGVRSTMGRMGAAPTPPAAPPQSGASTPPPAPSSTPMQTTASPSQPTTTTQMVATPREAFWSPQEQMIFQQTAPAEALYQFVKKHGGSEEEATRAAIFRAKGMPTSSSMIAHPGGDVTGSVALRDDPRALDAYGQPLDPTTTYRRQLNLYSGETQYLPVQTPPGQLGSFQTIAGPDGKPHVYRIRPDNSRVDMGEKPVGVVGRAQAYTIASQMLGPTANPVDVEKMANILLQPEGGAAPGSPLAGGPATAPPPAPGATPAVAPASAPPAAVGASPAATPPPSPGSSTAAAPTQAPVKPAQTRADAMTNAGFTNPRQPMSQDAKNTISQIQEVQSQIPKLLTLLDKNNLNSDNPADTAKTFDDYLSGRATSPVADQLGQLLNFVRVIGAQPYMRGSRSIRWVEDIQAHLPRIPQGAWEAKIGSMLPASVSSPIASTLTRSEGYDSFKLIREKLQTIQQTLPQIQQAIEQQEGAKPSKGAPPPPSSTTPAGGTPIYNRQTGRIEFQ